MSRQFSMALYIVLLMVVSSASAQYVVTSIEDLPDANLKDGIYFPHTLRSAIQNANEHAFRAPATIEIAESIAGDTFRLKGEMRAILTPTTFNGRGIVIEPAAGVSLRYGLHVGADNCKLSDFTIRRCSVGVEWYNDYGLIEGAILAFNCTGIDVRYAKHVVIGGKLRGAYSNYIYGGANVIGYEAHGVSVRGDSCTIQNTSIGVDEHNNPRGNEMHGIRVHNHYSSTVIRNNLISANKLSGIYSVGFLERYRLIEGNLIGTDATGMVAYPNLKDGITLIDSDLDSVRNNLISGNNGAGISATDGHVCVDNNTIGLNILNGAALPNSVGIESNGYKVEIRKNIVAGNLGAGVITRYIAEISNNVIGTDSTRGIFFGNGSHGIRASGRPEISYDTSSIRDNVLSGNKGCGIQLGGTASYNWVIANNIIGTDTALSMQAPNGGGGINVLAQVTNVAITNNVIAYSTEHGIAIGSSPSTATHTTSIRVIDNTIGLPSRKGSISRSIGGSGISIRNANEVDISRNRIRSCSLDGITLENDSVTNIEVTANSIGSYDGDAGSHVKGNGVHVKGASKVRIRSSSIAACGGLGVSVKEPSRGVYIEGNAMCDNVGGGIELDDLKGYYNGAADDAYDSDIGVNNLMNTFTVVIGRIVNGKARVRGWLEGWGGWVSLYLDHERPDSLRFLSQGCIPLGTIFVGNDNKKPYMLDATFSLSQSAEVLQQYPVVLLAVGTPPSGSSQFSLPPLSTADTVGVDLAVKVDSAIQDANSDTVRVYATISNEGFGTANNVVLVDSVEGSGKHVAAGVARGSLDIAQRRLEVWIPSIARGEQVRYYSIGTKNNQDLVRHLSVKSEHVDYRPRNDKDTALFINESISNVYEAVHREVTITNGTSGYIIVSNNVSTLEVFMYDLTGRQVDYGRGFHVTLSALPGVYALRIKTGEVYQHKIILVN